MVSCKNLRNFLRQNIVPITIYSTKLNPDIALEDERLRRQSSFFKFRNFWYFNSTFSSLQYYSMNFANITGLLQGQNG